MPQYIDELAFLERRRYAYSLKYERDLKNTTDTAARDGFNKGKAEGIFEGIELGKAEGLAEGEAVGVEKGVLLGLQKAALKMHSRGFAVADIAADLEVDIALIQEWLP